MKVILLQNVARIGKKYEVKHVPDGHALNFLIPKKLAEPATPHSLRKIEDMKQKTAAVHAASDDAFMAVVAALKDTPVALPAQANDQGHLFKGIKADDIAGHLASLGHALEVSAIDLGNPIKEVGEHTISLVHGDQKAQFTLTVTAQ